MGYLQPRLQQDHLYRKQFRCHFLVYNTRDIKNYSIFYYPATNTARAIFCEHVFHSNYPMKRYETLPVNIIWKRIVLRSNVKVIYVWLVNPFTSISRNESHVWSQWAHCYFIQCWVRKFKYGLFSILDEVWPGRPADSTTDDYISKVKGHVFEDRRIILINYLIHVTRTKFLIGQFSIYDRCLEVKNTRSMTAFWRLPWLLILNKNGGQRLKWQLPATFLKWNIERFS